MAFAQPASDPAFFGILRSHWNDLVQFARERGYVVALRTGKRAALPWIQRGFPAKPLALKTKVCPETGLLIARSEADRQQAQGAGFPVLTPTGPNAREYIAQLQGGRTAFAGQTFGSSSHDWARDGLIMDPVRRLPFTSDYDLAAVVDTEQLDYEGTYMSRAGMANSTNVLVASVAGELNRRFGSPRIVHGSQAQYSGGMGHGDDDTVLIFHPDGFVEHVGPVPEVRTDQILHGIFMRYHPDSGHLFRQ
jgi:hypothetical protein